MTYREFNNAFLNSSTALAEHCRKDDSNCPYIENLIYRPSAILTHRPDDFDDQAVRNWDDEITETDKAYLYKVCGRTATALGL